jgi:O-antigen biosynthesis protein WbqP
MKRLVDLFGGIIALLLLAVPIIIVGILVRLTSKGSVLYWSDRVGRHNAIFKMPKFRTMRMDTPAVATHLLPDPKSFLTPIGGFLRKSSLDELPQIWSILAMAWMC